jgi:hypothetical protein
MLEDEYSHKNIDRSTQINITVINSNEYRRKFDNATNNPRVNKTLYEVAKMILTARSGTHYESMYWIDGETGKIITQFVDMGRDSNLTGSEHELKVEYGKNILRRLKGHNNIVVIHNHPNSTAPSVGDFNSAYKNNYAIGFVVTHNGRIYRYTSGQEISDVAYDIMWQKYFNRGLDEFDAQIKSIEQLMIDADITFEEVLI